MNAAMKPETTTQPWWRFGMVWLVIAGPAVVVVASFVTLRLALIHGDPVISERPVQTEYDASHTPAVKARNHAASPRP